MKRIPRRRKGIQYYFFNGIGMQMTYDMGPLATSKDTS